MKFEQRVNVTAPKQVVADFLADFQQAARCLPGVEDLRDLGNGQHEGRIRVRVGPLGFNIAGKVQVELSEQRDGWLAHGEGRDGRIGAGVKASVEARLVPLDENATELLILADVRFSGRLAELGQPLIKRKADSLLQEFAENLRKAVSCLTDASTYIRRADAGETS